MGAVLAGSLAAYPEPDASELTYSPSAAVQALFSTIQSPLRLAPKTTADRLVAFLSDPYGVMGMFEYAADGGVLRDFAAERNIPYYAIAALYESEGQPFKAMRECALRAVVREDRERARARIRRGNGLLSEHGKRYVDSLLKMVDSSDPAPKGAQLNVNVGVSFGAALVARQQARRAAITIVQDDGGEDLGL